MAMRKYFDIHTHVWPDRLAPAACRNLGDFYVFPIEGKGTVSDLTEVCTCHGIAGALMLCVATNARQVRAVNDGAAAAVAGMRASGLLSYAFGGYHQDCTDAEETVAHALEIGLSGFKLHPDSQGADIDDERFLPLYRCCEEAGLPVYFHMGDARPQYRFSEAVKLLRVKEKFPSLMTVAAHLGGYSAWDDAALLAETDNILFDTSSSLWAMSPERAVELIHMLGTDRVMFGTDYPVVTAATELPRFERLELTEAEKDAIAFGNAARFLGF